MTVFSKKRRNLSESSSKQQLTTHLHSTKPFHINGYARLMTMERIHWIYTPFLLAILCTIPGYITGLPVPPGPTPQINTTDIVTDLQSITGIISESSTSKALPQYSSTNPSEVPPLLPHNTGDALNNTGRNITNQSTVNQTSFQNITTTALVATTITTLPATTSEPPTTTASAAITTQSAATMTPSAAKTTPSTATTTPVQSSAILASTLPTSTTTSHPSTSTSSSTVPHTSTVVQTFTTQSIIPVHEGTLPVTTTPRGGTTQGAPTTTTTTRESTRISDHLTTKESGDWNIIGISGNSFTGKILLPIAVGTAFSVIIIAVAYCYCSRRGSNNAAKSSRNGVHRMTSNDRVMLLADSSEDEF